MNEQDVLKTCLLDLNRELEPEGIPLILGGGYGLYLKQLDLQAREVRTLLDMEMWPEPRATNDLDVFLQAEIVTNAERMEVFRQALDRLGYAAIESAKYYQFVKPISAGRKVKLDLLAGPLGDYEERVPKDPRRVRPRPSVDLHARRVDEAVGIEEKWTELRVVGVLSDGDPHAAKVFIPQGFSCLLMKLYAFRDQRENNVKEFGQHHALDCFRIVAMMTKDEYELVLALSERHQHHARVEEAKSIVSDHFSDEESLGVLRLREHPLFRSEMDVEGFLRELNAIFHI